MAKLNLRDGYFSVPLHRDSRKKCKPLVAGNLSKFLCLYFGLGPARIIFTNVL